MVQRTCLKALFFAACFCGYAHGQAVHAGCMQGCGGTNSGSSSNNATTKPTSQQNSTAAAMNAMQNNLQTNTQMINNAGAAILNALQPNNNSDADTTSNSSDDNSTGQPFQPSASAPDPAALEAANAAAAARQREQFNAEAAQLLQESQVDTATVSDGAGGTAAAVNSLLDSAPPANNSNSAIGALLGDSAQPNTAATSTANAVSNLLDINKVSDSASAFPAYIPLAQPDDPRFAAAMQDTVNQPDPSASASLLQMLQGTGQQVEDQLTGIVSSSRALVSSVLDNRFVQWGMSDKGSFTTAPLPVPSDSPDTAAGLVSAQSVVGFGTILKECVQYGPLGCIKGVKGYGTAMINQMGADLGYAQVNIVQDSNSDPNN
jgi:hypothetical protein